MKKIKMKDTAKQLVAVILAFLMSLSVLTDAITVKAEEAENTAAETESESTGTESTSTEQEDTEAESPDAGTDNTVSYEGEGYAVTCNIINSWGEGYTAEVSIKNTSDKKIHNWNLMFALDGEITDIWNAKISSRNEDGLYTVEGESYNSNISPDSAVSFGFNASGSQEIPEFHFSQSVQMPVEEGDFEVDYAVSDDWETGFVGEIGILNKSSKSFKDWCITFDWDNDIDGIWNAKIVSHEENHYVISCEEYNRIIEAGQRVQFGFSCPSGKSSTRPENIAVTHFTDGDGKVEDNGDGEDEIDPSEVTEYVDIEFRNGNCAQSVLDDMRFVNYAPELLDVAWVSSDESVVTNDGHVTRGEEDRTVTVTAEIQYKGKDYRKEFTLTVKRKTDIDVDTLQDYSLSQLEQMNSGDEDYDVDVNDYRYLESIYGTYSEVKVDSYETALLSLYNIKSLLGIENPFEELKVTDVKADETGYIFKFDQMYKGLQVLDSGITVSSDENGKVDYLDSGYFPVLNELNISPEVTREDAARRAGQDGYREVEPDDEEGEQAELLVFNEYGKGSLAWSLFCQHEEEPQEWYEVLVDAQTGELLGAYDMTCSAYKEKTGTDLLNNQRQFGINKKGFDFINPTYRLEDTKRNIEIYNAKNGNRSKNSKLIVKSNDVWSPTEVSAMANTEYVYDSFKQEFGMKSYDSKGATIKVYIYTSIEDNAYWNGKAIWVGKGTEKRKTFKEMSLAAGADILAHEFTHAVVGKKTKLREVGTVGIINEAYADIFACYAEENWKIGEQVTLGDCLRNISNPMESGDAVKVDDDNFISYHTLNKNNDWGGVHQNSTIISHIAYRMEKDKFKVRPRDIWYLSLCLGYKKHSDLYDVRKNVVKAAQDLNCSRAEIKKINSFFDEANIKEENCNESTDYYKKLDEALKNKYSSNLNKEIQITGKIVKADKDFDFSNNKALDSVQVKNSSGEEIAKTDQNGYYHADIEEENPMVMQFCKKDIWMRPCTLPAKASSGRIPATVIWWN